MKPDDKQPIWDDMEQDARWRAVQQRDKQADGTFVYAVKTTGVYCSPSCASRLPRRENVVFFATAREAEQAGYRPCKRCRQGLIPLAEVQAERVSRACRLIEQAEKAPTLAQLAQAVNMSPFHFHRLFHAITGVTPKGYIAALRGQRIRQQLTTNASVTEAIFDAGFSSNGHFYRESNDLLGMSPKTFQNKGQGMTINFALGRCSLGDILAAESERGICAILLGDDAETLLKELQDMFANASLVGDDAGFALRMAQVVGFVDAPATGLTLPLDIRGTVFQQRVWRTLREIPPGETLSYLDVACKIGLPRAVRAVAGACAANRLAVAIPCHRVIRNSGELSGYRWGIERKRRLLEKEAGRTE